MDHSHWLSSVDHERAGEESACPATCGGKTCDDWAQDELGAFTCAENEEFGCDCGGCACAHDEGRRLTHSATGECPNDCVAYGSTSNCYDWFGTEGRGCVEMTMDFGCDCSGCDCSGQDGNHRARARVSRLGKGLGLGLGLLPVRLNALTACLTPSVRPFQPHPYLTCSVFDMKTMMYTLW